MTYRITAPNKVDALINLPASKSISNRALIIHALSGGATTPENLSHCDDTDVMRAALSNMPDVIDIGAAGTAMRFLTALLSTTEGQHTITGTERMKQRPITVLVDALRKLGADIEYEENEGFPPLRINGRQLLGGELQMPGNVSSQYVSALLMVGAVLQRGLTLHLTGEVISRPYIDLTLSMMRHYGAEAAWEADNTITVKSTGYQDRPFLIENDWSAASYWYAIMALTADDSSTVSLPGLFDGSQQGDSVVRFLYSMMGVKTSFADGGVVLTKHASNLPRIDYDFTKRPPQPFLVRIREGFKALIFAIASSATGSSSRHFGSFGTVPPKPRTAKMKASAPFLPACLPSPSASERISATVTSRFPGTFSPQMVFSSPQAVATAFNLSGSVRFRYSSLSYRSRYF